MKYLTDSDIIKWSERLPFTLVPRYSNVGSHPDIVIKMETNHFNRLNNNFTPTGEYQIVESDDIMIDYQFSFSVISNRTDHFFNILNRLLNNEFGTKLSYRDSNGKENLTGIYLNKEHLNKIKSEKHTLLKREFTKYTFNLKDKLTSIVCFLSYVEDAIEFFQLIWEYDIDGKEKLLMEYPIGGIVSTLENKSKDYLIIDYDYNRINGKYLVNYILSEIIFEEKSTVIRYGKPMRYEGREICHSRNNRIDDILGK